MSIDDARAIRHEADNAVPERSELTPREREVMDLIVAGLTRAEVARRCGFSVKTYDTHRKNAMSKLGVTNIVAYVVSVYEARNAALQNRAQLVESLLHEIEVLKGHNRVLMNAVANMKV